MDINIQPVGEQSPHTQVEDIANALRQAEPGTYSVGISSQGEVNRLKDLLRERNFDARAKKMKEPLGRTIATKGQHVGQEVDIPAFDLRVAVRAGIGEDEPTLAPLTRRARKSKDENGNDSNENVDTINGDNDVTATDDMATSYDYPDTATVEHDETHSEPVVEDQPETGRRRR